MDMVYASHNKFGQYCKKYGNVIKYYTENINKIMRGKGQKSKIKI